MRTTPLTQGEDLPSLELCHVDGRPAALETLTSHESVALYFMRTPSCPVCHAHLRHIERAVDADSSLVEKLIVIVPGGAADAASVERRHSKLAGRVLASETAHANVGLFVRGGLQQSGTFVVTSGGTVISARSSTIPLRSYDETETLAALATTRA